MSASWFLVKIGDSKPIHMFEGAAVQAAVTACLVTAGEDIGEARNWAESAWGAVCDPSRRDPWTYVLPDMRKLLVTTVDRLGRGGLKE